MISVPHGPALIKSGLCMGNVVEFYGVFIQGALQPHRFNTYAEAERHFNNVMEQAA